MSDAPACAPSQRRRIGALVLEDDRPDVADQGEQAEEHEGQQHYKHHKGLPALIHVDR